MLSHIYKTAVFVACLFFCTAPPPYVPNWNANYIIIQNIFVNILDLNAYKLQKEEDDDASYNAHTNDGRLSKRSSW